MSFDLVSSTPFIPQRTLGSRSGRFEDPQGPLGKLRSSLFLQHVPANNHFSAILEKHEFPYVDVQLSMKIIEYHKKAFASNAIWTLNCCHFFHMPLGKPFGVSISMKTVFSIKIHVHLPSCRKRSRACILMKSKVLGIAQTFHRAPLDPPRASLFTLSGTPKNFIMLTM